ncbi:hypothetical protein ANANG_G00141700 [Anguilla anguilla]|uniref:F-box domain-containing protein n=1 Tax=Anguilla anguilla TaxID=7936 RepID=A0A9D3RY20_ANGAN|nr:hypothetical protein ANANG_G00141700 [Anguilla anguilla]
MAALEGNIAPGFFGNLDESMALSHLLEKAYSCYRKSLTKMCFKAWVKFILRRRKEAAELVLKMRAAEDLYEARRRRQALRAWRDWLQTRKQRQHEAVKKIQGVWNAVLCGNVLQAWRHVAQDSKKTKEYFERLEKGLLETDIYHTGATPMEGQDGVSLLPWRAALKIFQNLEVGDLVKCGQVCRTWKAIAQTYSLWSCINFSSERADHGRGRGADPAEVPSVRHAAEHARVLRPAGAQLPVRRWVPPSPCLGLAEARHGHRGACRPPEPR